MKKIVLFIALIIVGLGLNAQAVGDVTTIDYDGYSLEFKVTSVEPYKCEVRCSNYPQTYTSIIIPSEVEIGNYVCSVTDIGEGAFENCTNLTSIELPKTITYIGYRAFIGCSNMIGLRCYAEEVPETHWLNPFDSPANINIQVPEQSVREYNETYPWAHYCVTHIHTYFINGETTIDYGDYSLFFSATSIEPAECMFDGVSIHNTSVSITIPSTVTIDGIEYKVTSIGYHAIYEDSHVTEIVIPNTVTYIAKNAINAWKLSHLEIPNSVTYIGNEAFYNCSSLISIEIPSSVTYIGRNPFSASLTSIVVEKGNPIYDSRENCNAIIETSSNTLITGCQNTLIPKTVTTIGNGAFYHCSNLTRIDIPSSVTTIGSSAFFYCSKLKSIRCYSESVPQTANTAFDYVPSDMQIQVPEQSKGLYREASPWNKYTIIKIYPYHYGEKYVVEEYDGYSLRFELNPATEKIEVCCETKPSLPTSVTIPLHVTIDNVEYAVTDIQNAAFQNCSNITSVDIPNTVTTIGSSAFAYCTKLKSIRCYSESVPQTANTAFDNVPSDMQIQVPEQSKGLYREASPWNKYTIIKIYPYHYGEKYVVEEYDGYSLRFELNPATEKIEVCCETKPSLPTSVTIPLHVTIDNVEYAVTDIQNAAFQNCSNITSVDIPNTVTTIGSSAFEGCSNLTSIKLPEGITDVRDNTFNGCSSLKRVELLSQAPVVFHSGSLSACSSLRGIRLHGGWCSNTSSDAFGKNASSSINVQVPEIYVNAFKNAEPWSKFNITKHYSHFIGDYEIINYGDYSLRYTIILDDNKEITSEVSGGKSTPDVETTIVIPESVEIDGILVSVTQIGYFSEWNKVVGLEIPSTITYIVAGGLPLYNLETINVDEDNVIYDSRNNCNAIINTEKKELVAGCKNTIIPEDIRYIGYMAFDGCNLRMIEIPDNIYEIRDYAFSGCYNLRCIRCYGTPDVQVTSNYGGNIRYTAFNGCPKTMNIQVLDENIGYFENNSPWNEFIISKIYPYPYFLGESSTVEYDGYKLKFTICNLDMPSCEVSCVKAPDSLMSIEIPATAVIADATFNVTKIADNGFANKSNITGVNFPSTLTSIGNNAFANCSDLERLFFGNNLIFTTLGENAFADCTKLSAIDMPSNVTTINKGTFKNCIAFKNIILPNYVSTIADSAFYNCSNLTSLNLPQFVNSIGNKAFSNCSNLISLKCHAENVPTTAESAFDNLPNNMIIQVPPTSVGLYNKVSPWNKFSVVGGFSYLITAAPNDYSYGIVSGAGTYNAGANVTLVANPLQSSIFDYWTENGMVVSTDAEYSFTIERDRILIANFNSRHWNADKEQYSGKMSMMAKVEINGQEQNNPYLEVGAFCGDEVRGSQRLKYIGNNRGSFLLEMDIFGKDNDVISFKLFDHEKNIELNLFNDEDIKFDDKGSLGSENTPYIISFNEKNDDNDDDANEDEDGNEDGNDIPTPKPLDAPENIEAKALSSSSIMLTWDHVEDALKYHVYQDDEFIAIAEETEFLVEGLEADTRYCFYVIAVNDSIESDESDEDCARTKDGESINELSSSINIYPNPVDNELILATELRVEEIAIYDIYGRMTTVYGLQTTDFIHTIDVADLEAGVYFVNIKTENGNIVKRFIKN